MELTSGWPPSSAATGPPRSCSRRPPHDGHASLGFDDAGAHRGRPARRPGHPRHRHAPHRRHRRATSTPRSSRPPRPTSSRWSSTAGSSSARATTQEIGRELDAAIGSSGHDASIARSPASASWSPTTRPARRTTRSASVTDAALVLDGRPGRLGRAGGRRARPPTPHVDVGGRAVIPGFVDSHSHLVFAGDRAPEFAARMAGTPYAAGGIRTTVAATRAATDEQLTAQRRPAWSPRCAARAPPPSRSRAATASPSSTRPAAWPSPGSSPTRRPSSARTSCRPSTPTTRRATSTWSPARCSRRARRTPGGSTCSASAAPSTPTRPARSSRPARRTGSGAGCTPTSSAPVPASGWPAELGLAAVDHCTYLDDADVAALADSRHGRHAAAGGGVLAPGRRTPTPAGCSTPASRSRSPATATRGPATPPRCRCASPWPCGRCG